MKGLGIFFIVNGAIVFLIQIIGLCTHPEYAEAQIRLISGSLMSFVVGGLLVHSANKRKKEEEERKEWNQ